MRVPLKMKGGASSTVIKIYLTNYEFIRGAIYVRRDIHTSELLSLNPDLYVFLCCRSFTSPLIILVCFDVCHYWRRNCLSFKSTCVHPRLISGFVLLNP